LNPPPPSFCFILPPPFSGIGENLFYDCVIVKKKRILRKTKSEAAFIFSSTFYKHITFYFTKCKNLSKILCPLLCKCMLPSKSNHSSSHHNHCLGYRLQKLETVLNKSTKADALAGMVAAACRPQIFCRLRQEDHLNPGVRGQPE
jgi:hypothetical protein